MDFIFYLLLILVLNQPAAFARHWSKDKNPNSLGQTEDLIDRLPGQPKVNFQHYAGYVTVNEQRGRALFYWFYEASNLPVEKPLVLWLNGGPGCSSVGYGATQEIGPFVVDKGGRTLKINPYSWNSEANMLFLESPIGVGYSYSNTTTDYVNLGDDLTAQDSHAFLVEWFLKFPEYRNRTFYIAGESYAGVYVPELADLILEKNSDPSIFINLKGILLGNPVTYNPEDWKGIVDYAWSHAVISDETYKTIKQNCDFYGTDEWSEVCSDAVAEMYKQYEVIDMYSIYTSACSDQNSSLAISESQSQTATVSRKPNHKMIPRMLGGYDPCLDNYARYYYNRADVQKALHVNDGQRVREWSICNMTVYNGWSWSDSKDSMLPIYKKLIVAGLRIWLYSGDTDGRMPVLSTRYSLSSIGLPIKQAWRPWYHQRQVGGWVQEYKGLTFATFRGAGHAVPIFKPSEALAFFSAFLSGESPPFQR